MFVDQARDKMCAGRMRVGRTRHSVGVIAAWRGLASGLAFGTPIQEARWLAVLFDGDYSATTVATLMVATVDRKAAGYVRVGDASRVVQVRAQHGCCGAHQFDAR